MSRSASRSSIFRWRIFVSSSVTTMLRKLLSSAEKEAEAESTGDREGEGREVRDAAKSYESRGNVAFDFLFSWRWE